MGDFSKCQSFAASPAEPGDLPCWVSAVLTVDRSLPVFPFEQASAASVGMSQIGSSRPLHRSNSQLYSITSLPLNRPPPSKLSQKHWI